MNGHHVNQNWIYVADGSEAAISSLGLGRRGSLRSDAVVAAEAERDGNHEESKAAY